MKRIRHITVATFVTAALLLGATPANAGHNAGATALVSNGCTAYVGWGNYHQSGTNYNIAMGETYLYNATCQAYWVYLVFDLLGTQYSAQNECYCFGAQVEGYGNTVSTTHGLRSNNTWRFFCDNPWNGAPYSC
ncbi:MAG TPA: hypothetical protein VF230_00280 [Acidimicrobiales bacterium]